MSNLSPLVFTVPVAALAMVAVIVWIEQRTQQSRLQAQRDVQLALLQKFSSGEELSQFLATPQGKSLVEALSVPQASRDPRKKMLEQFSGGLILIFLGAGFYILGSAFYIPGIICFALGVGLIVAAGLTYWISQKFGLVPDEAE